MYSSILQNLIKVNTYTKVVEITETIYKSKKYASSYIHNQIKRILEKLIYEQKILLC